MIEKNLDNGRRCAIAIGIIIQVLLLIGGGQGATITVNASGGGDYMTIQGAINAAGDNDSIIVAGGIYNENVNVNKSVYLNGDGAGITVVNASNSNSHVFNISRNDVVLEGFSIKGALGSNKAGIYIFRANNTSIYNNSIISNYNGINLYNSSNNNLTGNTVTNVNEGIFLHQSPNNSLNGNNVSNNYDGIYLYSSYNNNLTDNLIESNEHLGVQLYFSGNNSMRNNSINKNRNQGIQIYDSGNNTLEQNHITSNNNSGIYLYLTGNNSIYDNIFNNTNNFEIYYSDGNIWNMTVIQNMNIIGGHYMGGNFWANPSGSGFSQTCIDADMNGICDSSYELIPGNTDIHPLMVASGYLNGTVTSNGSAVSGACIITTGANTTSDPDGVYSLIVPAGTYNITVTKQPTHNDSKVAGIIVNSSDITTLDIVLSQKPTGTITGIVYEA